MADILPSLVLPSVILFVGLIMLFGRAPYFESFVTGAKNGLRCAVGLLPTLVALVVAVSMLGASGFTDFACRALEPAVSRLGIPSGILPLLLTRPVSGSASTAVFSSLIEKFGADSFEVFCASVIMGSSDTMLYVITVYFSSVGLRSTRYAFPCATAVMIFVILLSCAMSGLFFV